MAKQETKPKAAPKTMSLEEKLHHIQQGLVVPKAQRNDFGKFNFRSAEDILNALKPLLKLYECNVTLGDTVVVMDGHLMIKAEVQIECIRSGTARSAFSYAGIGPLKGMSIAQTYGASSSYARKYAMNGMFAIDEHTDADLINDEVPAEQIKKMEVSQHEVVEPDGAGFPDPKKQTLTNPSKRWDNVVKRLEAGSATIETVESAFNIEDKDLIILKSIKKK